MVKKFTDADKKGTSLISILIIDHPLENLKFCADCGTELTAHYVDPTNTLHYDPLTGKKLDVIQELASKTCKKCGYRYTMYERMSTVGERVPGYGV